MMRIGIVVDSCCDLPQAYFDQNDLAILPITVRIGESALVDYRDMQTTLGFLHSEVAKRAHEAETLPFTVEQVQALFLNKLALNYDHVFCLTITKNRSQIYENVVRATPAILRDCKPARQAKGDDSPFTLRIIDTQTIFAGQGVTAVEAVRLRETIPNVGQIRARLEFLAANTYMYAVPYDLYYLRTRARAKGDHSVGLASALLGSALSIRPVLRCYSGNTEPVAKVRGFENAVEKMLNFIVAQVRKGLMTPTVCLSYGGELGELHALPGYAKLRHVCADYNVEFFESVMSLTAMINIGKGSLIVGFAAEPHVFDA
jgi:DegV family protein with EDD domain